jgi:hypothetical protein
MLIGNNRVECLLHLLLDVVTDVMTDVMVVTEAVKEAGVIVPTSFCIASSLCRGFVSL